MHWHLHQSVISTTIGMYCCCRYCSGKKGKGKKGKFGVDYSGASHIAELHALLRATVMVSSNGIAHSPGLISLRAVVRVSARHMIELEVL